MIWYVIALTGALVYVAMTHDKHINRLYAQVAELEQARAIAEQRAEVLSDEIDALNKRLRSIERSIP